MCFAHRITERNIWVKFNENQPKGSDENSKVNTLTLTCDLDLESR